MDVLIPLLAFLLGLGVHRWRDRWRRAREKRIEVRARLDVVLLDAKKTVAYLKEENVRLQIEKLIQETRR